MEWREAQPFWSASHALLRPPSNGYSRRTTVTGGKRCEQDTDRAGIPFAEFGEGEGREGHRKVTVVGNTLRGEVSS